jgi:hypothetical protein
MSWKRGTGKKKGKRELRCLPSSHTATLLCLVKRLLCRSSITGRKGGMRKKYKLQAARRLRRKTTTASTPVSHAPPFSLRAALEFRFGKEDMASSYTGDKVSKGR